MPGAAVRPLASRRSTSQGVHSRASLCEERGVTIPNSTLDHILTVQLNVAWAGEHDCQPPRLAWWRCDLSSPASGGDFLARLLPTTWKWAALIGIRKAAQTVDATKRRSLADGDAYRSLFDLGPLLNERLDERLNEHRTNNKPPKEVLPELLFRLDIDDDDASAFDKQEFADFLNGLGPTRFNPSPAGRLLVGDTPSAPELLANKLGAMLVPSNGEFAKSWPFPHARARA